MSAPIHGTLAADDNGYRVAGGVSTVNPTLVLNAKIDPSTGRLLVNNGGGGGGSIIVTDGVTTVTGVTTVDFTSGATVTDGGGGTADVAISGGGGSPGGSNLQVQYNNSGAFGGISGVTSNGTSMQFASGDLLIEGSGSGGVTLNAPATGGGTLTLPPGTDTVAGIAATQALTNKSVNGVTLTTGGGTTTFLNANGAYSTPAGSGGTVTTVSVATANGFAGTVANATTTPAITLTTSVTAAALAGNGTAISAATTTGTGSTVVLSASPALTGTPTAPTQTAGDNTTAIATDAFVTTAINNAIAGVNPAVAVLVTTTSSGDTSALAYNNGASGIGATLTGTINTPITIDGVLLNTLGQRLLVKNDTQTTGGASAGAFNGIYTVTIISTAGTAPVLTRALDYDTPSDINNTGAIPVVSGTANTNTSWLLTSTITTVGTNALTYVQFSLAPSTIMTKSVYDAANIAQQVLGTTATQTVTNKRITRRVVVTTQSATPTINTDNTDMASITGLAQAITSMTTNLSGTPVQGDFLEIQITDNGTARGITWGASFVASTVALPTTTVISTLLHVLFEWDATLKWVCVAVA